MPNGSDWGRPKYLLVPDATNGKLVVCTAPGLKFWQELSEVCCANNGASTNDAKVPQKTLRARLPGQKTTQERPRQLEETTKGLQRTPKSSRNRPQASPKGPRGPSKRAPIPTPKQASLIYAFSARVRPIFGGSKTPQTLQIPMFV